ncbi:hypothetical protein DBR23_07850 [Acidovorax sp. HMWF018]|uniref:hypothetical protein n=1 Tax=Acidovorax sp. HMWF018 TaxID=2056855 RepID=UPI000D39B819|nr:hypothetical protein [Acidovorax sp. HMWF018]PTT40672.1 hypothetical protein DBR23_07850 [Acidovorax sp. HMWF018]
MKTLSWIRQRQPLWMPALATVAAMALAGCATMAAPPEKVVEQRATEYWKARIAGDYAKAYSLSTPSYRKVHTVEKFRVQFGVGANIEAAEPLKVTCESREKCTARMKLSATPALLGMKLGRIDTYVDETWLLEDGKWWRYQDL